MKILQSIATAILVIGISTASQATTLKASFYKSGSITASGEKFRPFSNTAASNHFKFGTQLRLSYKGKSAIICINDTGNFGKYHRSLDVTKGVAQKLGFVKLGVVTLQSQVIFKPKKNKSCTSV
jgi:rare lipoprotein A